MNLCKFNIFLEMIKIHGANANDFSRVSPLPVSQQGGDRGGKKRDPRNEVSIALPVCRTCVLAVLL